MNKEELFAKRLSLETHLTTPDEIRDLDQSVDREYKRNLKEIKKELNDNKITESEYDSWVKTFISNAYEIVKDDKWITHHYVWIAVGNYKATFCDYRLDDFLDYIRHNGSAIPTEKRDATEAEIKNAIALNAEYYYLTSFEKEKAMDFEEDSKEDLFKYTLQFETELTTNAPWLDKNLELRKRKEFEYNENIKSIEENGLKKEYEDWCENFIESLYKEFEDKDWVTIEYFDITNMDIDNMKSYKITTVSEYIDSINDEMNKLLGQVACKDPVKATEDEIKLAIKLHASDMNVDENKS